MMLSSDQSSMSGDQITTFTFFPPLSLSLKLAFSLILRATSPCTLSQLNRHGLTHRPFFITFTMRSIFSGSGRKRERQRSEERRNRPWYENRVRTSNLEVIHLLILFIRVSIFSHHYDSCVECLLLLFPCSWE